MTRLDAATLDLPVGRLDQLLQQRLLVTDGDPAYATTNNGGK
jgi:hypothetical protein